MSLTISSLFAFLVGRLLQSTGLPATDESITNFVSVTLQVLSAFGIWFGRWRAGDITWFGGRKSKI